MFKANLRSKRQSSPKRNRIQPAVTRREYIHVESGETVTQYRSGSATASSHVEHSAIINSRSVKNGKYERVSSGYAEETCSVYVANSVFELAVDIPNTCRLRREIENKLEYWRKKKVITRWSKMECDDSDAIHASYRVYGSDLSPFVHDLPKAVHVNQSQRKLSFGCDYHLPPKHVEKNNDLPMTEKRLRYIHCEDSHKRLENGGVKRIK